METFNQPDVQRIVYSVSWTLIHSFWQGMLVAAIAGLAMVFSAKSNSAFRYNALCLLLSLFIVASIGTFTYEFVTASREAQIPSVEPFNNSAQFQNNIVPAEFEFTPDQTIAAQLTAFFDRNIFSIIAIWFIVFLFKSVRMATGLIHLRKIRKTSKYETAESWKRNLKHLAEKIGITVNILLAESRHVTSPIVIGILKPVIIVPVGFLSNIPFDQVEAILLHELAHIKRRDYLVNLLQSFAEVVFFFNPAVLLLSRMIRKEREYCCDDIAVSAIADKKVFVNALVFFQELRLASSGQMVSFAGEKNQLLYRIKRLITNHNHKPLNAMEKIFVTSCIIATTILTVAFSKIEVKNQVSMMPEITKVLAEPAVPEIPLVEAKTSLPTTNIDSKTFVSNDTLPKFDTYSQEIIEAKKQLDSVNAKGSKVRKQGTEIWMENQLSKRQLIETKLRANVFESKNNDQLRNISANVGDKNINNEKQFQLNLALAKMRQAVVSQDSIRLMERLEQIRRVEDAHKEKAIEMREELDNARKVYYGKMKEGLINDLLNEGIAKSKEDLSFRLYAKAFIVNGVVQPESVKEKFMAKYLDLDFMEWKYNFEGDTGYFVSYVR